LDFQKQTEDIIAQLDCIGNPPGLLLHSCCAPCSSYVLSFLAQYFKTTVLYFNPNIFPESEYKKRLAEQNRIIKELPVSYPVDLIEGNYSAKIFSTAVKGHELDREGGERCRICISMRMRESALYAAKNGFEWFTTTLSVSPHKNADFINECGFALQEELKVKYLPADFKKRDGYKISI
jgi:predicted adenine nucleotide alpha hydrolase (AANH) superfamily ATPase